MKPLLFLIILLMIPFSLGYTVNYLHFNSTNYNSTQQTSLTVLINTTVNKTVTIHRIDNATEFNLSWTKNITSRNITFRFLFNVSLNKLITKNFTKNITFNITNNINPSTDLFKIQVNYTYRNYSIKRNESKPYLVILHGNYTVNLSNTLNNRRATLNYTLLEQYGNYSSVKCSGSWLVCEDYPIVFTNGTANYHFDYNIPLNAPIGISKQNITFTLQRSDNNEVMSVTRTIIFDIHAPDISMLIYNPPEECIVLAKAPNSTIYQKAVIQSCLDQYQEYYSAQLKAILDNYVPDNKTVTEYIDHYVMVGNISKVTIDELTTCRSERSSLTKTMIDVNQANVFLNRNATQCYSRQLIDYKEREQVLNYTIMSMDSQRNRELKSQDTKWKWIYFGTLGFLVLLSIFIYELKINENELTGFKEFKNE